MVHLCSDMWLVFSWVIRISCLMEGSVCSCDGDTMQDELYSIHWSSAWLLCGTANGDPRASFYLVNFFCHSETKQTTISVPVSERGGRCVIFYELWQRPMFFDSVLICGVLRKCRYECVHMCVCVCVMSFEYRIMIFPMVTVVFLLAHPCLSTCLFNNTELLLTGFLSKPVYL